jgi:type IX secretion system PorP/SprF family membrane protein
LPAQDIQFSQFYAVPVFLNPAYAGGAQISKLSFQQRVQWPGLSARFLTSMLAFDTYFHKYKSGFAVYVLKDYQGYQRISCSEIQFQYSYSLPLTDKLTLRSGLQLGIGSRSINYEHLNFPDQYNDRGYIGNTGENFSGDRLVNPDVGAGFLINSRKFWAGISSHHMNRPDISFDGKSRLPAKFSVAAGYMVFVKDLDEDPYSHQNVVVIPTVHYKSQGKSDQLDIGTYLNYEYFVCGIWYRGIPVKKYSRKLHNNESIVIVAGFKYDKFKFGYSYDFIFSRLVPARPLGAHELSLIYSFKNDKVRKLRKRLPCPDF